MIDNFLPYSGCLEKMKQLKIEQPCCLNVSSLLSSHVKCGHTKQTKRLACSCKQKNGFVIVTNNKSLTVGRRGIVSGHQKICITSLDFLWSCASVNLFGERIQNACDINPNALKRRHKLWRCPEILISGLQWTQYDSACILLLHYV